MKIVAALLVLLLQTALLQAQNTTLTINFKLTNAYGNVYIRLLDENGDKVDSYVLAVKTTMESYTFNNVTKGKVYAIDAFHDLNRNGELDKRWPGIPTEPYGFSNNVRGGILGPPELDDKKVLITKPTTITITVE
jgi:uncharacterized protein (DUF2141 family)